MTTITSTRAIDMATWDLEDIAEGTISTHTATTIVLTAPDGTVYTFTGTGFGAYDGENVPHVGTITKLVVSDALGTLTVASFSMSVTSFLGFVANGGIGFKEALLAGVDTLTGSALNDVLMGFGGNDTFNLSLGGIDRAEGGDGNDTFAFGGTLNSADIINGGAGSDVVTLDGDYSAYHLLGQTTLTSVEKLVLTAGHNYNIEFVEGNIAAGQTLAIDASGLGAADGFLLRALQDTNGAINLVGGAGVENVFGTMGADTLNGGGGDDLLYGVRGADKLVGGDGADYLNGGDGKDTLDGGAGLDRVSFADPFSTQAVVADLRTQFITNDGFGNTEVMTSIEGLGAGTRFADTLYGTDTANFFLGDTADTLATFGGNDMFQLGGAPGTVDGGDGTDTILRFVQSTAKETNADGIAENVTTTNGVVVDLNQGKVLNDGFGNVGTLISIENVAGTAGTDSLTGDRFANQLLGGDGADTLNGGIGNDVLWGDGGYRFDGPNGWPVTEIVGLGEGVDKISGAKGNDVIVGGAGADVLSGGAQADTFVYRAVTDSNQSQIDKLSDFTSGVDHIQLWFAVAGVDATVSTTKLGALGKAANAAHLGAHHAVLANVGGSTTFLIVDANGTAGYQAGEDLLIRLDGVAALTTGDFSVGVV